MQHPLHRHRAARVSSDSPRLSKPESRRADRVSSHAAAFTAQAPIRRRGVGETARIDKLRAQLRLHPPRAGANFECTGFGEREDPHNQSVGRSRSGIWRCTAHRSRSSRDRRRLSVRGFSLAVLASRAPVHDGREALIDDCSPSASGVWRQTRLAGGWTLSRRGGESPPASFLLSIRRALGSMLQEFDP